jgi:tetratricopeptide (TPR) repeat protein
MSFLDALAQRGRDFGLAVYAVEARGRQPAEVSRSMERYCAVYREPSFPVLPDPSFRTGRTYGVERIPVTFVMESHGVVLNRIEGYDHTAAVALTRRLEQLLRRERGFFSAELREAGISEGEERAAEARLAAAAAAAAARKSAPAPRALGTGDRAPEFEFTDLAGRTVRWSWGEGRAPLLRAVAFIEGFSLASIDELTWLDGLARRGRDAGLEALAIETGGMDAAALGAALERYRRYHPEPSFPVVVDGGGKLAGAFGPLERFPQTYLLAQDGTVIHRAEGFGTEEALLMTSKAERVFAQSGRPFPAARNAAGPAAGEVESPTPVDEEAPSIRRKREQDERHRSSIVQGDALFMAWEFERALPHYLAALEVQPKDLHALVRAAQILERLGQRQRALALWERVLALRPDHPEARERVQGPAPAR